MRRGLAFVLVAWVATAVDARAADFLTWKPDGFTVKPTGYFQGDVRAFPGSSSRH